MVSHDGNISSGETWKDQGNLVAYLLAAMPNGTELVLGDRERSALTVLLENLQGGIKAC